MCASESIPGWNQQVLQPLCVLQIEMAMGMPAIQEMPEEEAPESTQASPRRAGNSPNKAAPPLPAGVNGSASNGSQQEDAIVAVPDSKASKFSLADGEDPKLE
jgi:hypothetical protein